MNQAGGLLIILKKDKPRLGNNKQHTKKTGKTTTT
jgi:hypothetical protein